MYKLWFLVLGFYGISVYQNCLSVCVSELFIWHFFFCLFPSYSALFVFYVILSYHYYFYMPSCILVKETKKKKMWMWVSEKVGKPLGGVGEVLYTEYIVLKNIFSIKKIEKGSWNWWSWPTWIIDRSGDWIDFQLCWMIRTDITRADLKRQEKMRKERRNEI